MSKTCIVCSAVASHDIVFQYCAYCQSAVYCSKACQRKDSKQHKQICKHLNVGYGGMQIKNYMHVRLSIQSQELFERYDRCIDEDGKRFFKLFQESKEEGSRAAARKMMKIANRQTKHNQMHSLLNSLLVLIRCKAEMLSWPNSPLLVMLQFVDPNMLSGEGTPLHHLSDLADSSDYSTHEKQLIMAKQLIEHGANVNAVPSKGETPLHSACYSGVVTNLDFVELLLVEGADPNAQNNIGRTPLMYTIPQAPSAAKYLLNWPTTDANITEQSGESFLFMIRTRLIPAYVEQLALPNNPEQIQFQFLLQQWSEIEEMLVERGAHDNGINQGYGLGANAWLSVTKNGVIFAGLAILFCLFIGGYGMSPPIRS
jgi:hypothetical protein